MSCSEFELIQRYFLSLGSGRDDVVLPVGDDCALLNLPQNRQLAVSMDTLVAGVHFLEDTDPFILGHKSLAVNLSDLAAMGAEPAWVTLALTLTGADEVWVREFARGFNALAKLHRVALVGGDTTRGPLSITVQVHGFVTPGQALRRDGGQPGDVIYVTGTIGDAGVALAAMLGDDLHAAPHLELLRDRLERPEPRIEAGRLAVGFASAAIDISDGLLADLGHICEQSGVGAEIDLNAIPLSTPVKTYLSQGGDWGRVIAGGDDYELCLTIPEVRRAGFEEIMSASGVAVKAIGKLTNGGGVKFFGIDPEIIGLTGFGYDHFT